MRILPVEGRLIRDPFTKRPVPAEGLDVDVSNAFWARALADGDVEVDLADVVAPLVDAAGEPVDPPAGDLAADLKNPAAIAAASTKGK